MEAEWDSDLVVTAQLTGNGNPTWVDTSTEEARITVWDITDGTVLVNNEQMNFFDNTLGLFNYTTDISSSNAIYVYVEFLPWFGFTVSGTALLDPEMLIPIVADPPDFDILVEAGYVHNPWSTGLGITARMSRQKWQKSRCGPARCTPTF